METIQDLLSQPVRHRNRPLADRYPAETIDKVRADLREVAKAKLKYVPVPSYRQLANFMQNRYGVATSSHTMKAMVEEFMQEGK